MLKRQKKNPAFTLVEIIIVMIIVSGTLLTIVTYIQTSLKQVHQANHKIIALNLAKEGMEAMYYARNASILGHTGDNKDKCRLALDSKKCPTNSQDILGSGWYTIHYDNVVNTKTQTIYFKKHTEELPKKIKTLNETTKEYALYLSGDIRTTASGGKADNLNRYGRYFRAIQGEGIYQKKPDGNDTKLNCNNNEQCSDKSPKEYRFCSIVRYNNLGSTKEEKLCGVMTNFFE